MEEMEEKIQNFYTTIFSISFEEKKKIMDEMEKYCYLQLGKYFNFSIRDKCYINDKGNFSLDSTRGIEEKGYDYVLEAMEIYHEFYNWLEIFAPKHKNPDFGDSITLEFFSTETELKVDYIYFIDGMSNIGSSHSREGEFHISMGKLIKVLLQINKLNKIDEKKKMKR